MNIHTFLSSQQKQSHPSGGNLHPAKHSLYFNNGHTLTEPVTTEHFEWTWGPPRYGWLMQQFPHSQKALGEAFPD